jgi:hypothetical protein
MKIKLGLFLCVLMFTLAACKTELKDKEDGLAGVATDNVASYVSKEGKFSIKFLHEPQLSKERVAADSGDVEIITFMDQVSDSTIYILAYNDQKRYNTASTNVDTILVQARDGAIQNMKNGVLDEGHALKLENARGISFTAHAEGNYFIYHIFISGSRLYEIGMLQLGRPVDAAAAAAYFNSFKILP